METMELRLALIGTTPNVLTTRDKMTQEGKNIVAVGCKLAQEEDTKGESAAVGFGGNERKHVSTSQW